MGGTVCWIQDCEVQAGLGSLCWRVLGQDTLVSECLSPPRSIKWVPVIILVLKTTWQNAEGTFDELGSHPRRVKIFQCFMLHAQNLKLSTISYEQSWFTFIFSDILPFFQASQVITVNEHLPMMSVEPEVMTDRRTVKICCCIPKGDVLLNAWYINHVFVLLYFRSVMF